MIFTSFSFLLFLTCAIAGYFVCPAKYRWGVLLAASIVFYCLADVKFLPFILVTSAISFYTAKLIQKENENCAAKSKELESKAEIKELKENIHRAEKIVQSTYGHKNQEGD